MGRSTQLEVNALDRVKSDVLFYSVVLEENELLLHMKEARTSGMNFQT